MGTTTNKALRYPAASDAPDGPGGLFNLATDVDAVLSSATAFGPADLNTALTVSGVYRGSNLTNSPDGTTASFMVVNNVQGANQTQFAYRLADGAVFWRAAVSGTWSAWALGASATPDTSEAVGAFTVAAGWAIDSQDAFKIGGLADVSVVFHRTGGSITVPANGDIVNQTVATFRTGWAPLRGRGLTGGGTGAMAQAVVAPGTGLVLASLAVGGTSINSGDSFSSNGRYVLA